MKRQTTSGDEWNVPDWRDASAYPKPDALDETLWRWEFLRRREEYRRDWESCYRETYEHNLARSKDPEDLFFEKQIFEPSDPRFRASMDKSDRKYRLDRMPNPRVCNPGGLKFLWMLHQAIEPVIQGDLLEMMEKDGIDQWEFFNYDPTDDDWDSESIFPDADGLYQIVFNINISIEPQLKDAKSRLEKLQTELMGKLRRKRVPDSKEWPLLLRIIDARNAGISFSVIGVELLQLDKQIASSELAASAKSKHNTALGLFRN
jgi:hypothetical protein